MGFKVFVGVKLPTVKDNEKGYNKDKMLMCIIYHRIKELSNTLLIIMIRYCHAVYVEV